MIYIREEKMKPPLGSWKKLGAVLVVLILLGGSLMYFGIRPSPAVSYEKATIDDLLGSRSTRSTTSYDAVFAGLDSAYYALIATPVANFYDGKDDHMVPLLVVGEDMVIQDHGISRGITDFLKAYPTSSVVSIGRTPDAGAKVSESIDGGTLAKTSSLAALSFWTRSDGALLIKENQDGYNLGMPATVLASYLDIPVFVVKKTSDAVGALEKLDVKYVLEAGSLDPYLKTWKLRSVEEILNITALGVKTSDGKNKSVLGDRLQTNCSYVTLANPLDIHLPKVLATNSTTFTGTLTSKDTSSTYFPTTSDPSFEVDIPKDWKYTNVILDSYMPFTKSLPGRDPDMDGERSYVYFGVDTNGDSAIDALEFFAPSLAYEDIRDSSGNAVAGHAYMEHPIMNATGAHVVQIAGTLAMQVPPNVPVTSPAKPPTTTFNITVTVQKLADETYPYMPNMSSMAPYLTAYHKGVILGKPEYAINGPGPEVSCGCDQVTSEAGMAEANNKTLVVKNDLNAFLARLKGLDPTDTAGLAKAYAGMLPDAMPLEIMADPSMVPMFYYVSTGQGDSQEGLGIPSDNFYADIDSDSANAPFELDGSDPSYELAVGRLVGWDVQDQSAQIARTFFYNDIIDKFTGIDGQAWKDSAMNTFGSTRPVNYDITVTTKISDAWRQAGYAVDTKHDFALANRQYSAPYYEKANFIFFGAHGFFYWYVPPAYQKDAEGGGFDLAHVKDLNFGPSVIFGSSCVTGRTDGLWSYNTLSQTFLHSGMNAYIGATRESWGSFSIIGAPSGEVFGNYLGLMFFGYLTGYVYNKKGGLVSEGIGDFTVGQALLMSKNVYVKDCGTDNGGANDDTVEEFTLYGDPMFNPYEPNHNG